MSDHPPASQQHDALREKAIDSWAYLSRYAQQTDPAILGPIEQFAHVMAQLADIELPLIHPSTGTPVIDQATGQPIPQGDHPLGMTDAHVGLIAQGLDPFDHDADPKPFTPEKQRLAMHAADLAVAMVKEHRQDVAEQLSYLRKFQDPSMDLAKATSTFQSLAFDDVQQQVTAIMVRHAAEFGKLQAQFATAHGSQTDFIQPLARYVYHQGDVVPEPLHDVGQIALGRFATRFQQLTEDLHRATNQHIRKFQGR